MTRTVGTPHEIEPNTVLGVDSAFGVGELRVAHVCVQCVADQFPHALVWEPCAAERLVGVFVGGCAASSVTWTSGCAVFPPGSLRASETRDKKRPTDRRNPWSRRSR